MTQIRHPEVKVQLVGQDGNAFFILSRVTTAMKRAGVSEEEVRAFSREATSGDYNNLLRTVMGWVSTDEPYEDEDGYGMNED